jgi:uncharacterized protein YndB with AHSA1/START domain
MRLEESVVVERPIGEVFEYLTDPDRIPEWQTTALEARRETDGPLRVGSRFRETRKFLGRRLESTTEVVEYEPPHVFAVRPSAGPVPFQVTTSLSETAAGTRVVSVLEGEPGGFFRLGEPLVARALERELAKSLRALKRVLESRGG